MDEPLGKYTDLPDFQGATQLETARQKSELQGLLHGVLSRLCDEDGDLQAAVTNAAQELMDVEVLAAQGNEEEAGSQSESEEESEEEPEQVSTQASREHERALAIRRRYLQKLTGKNVKDADVQTGGVGWGKVVKKEKIPLRLGQTGREAVRCMRSTLSLPGSLKLQAPLW